MKFASSLTTLLVLATTAAGAQAGPPANRAALQRQVIERLITNFGNQAALSEEQLTRVRVAVAETFAERREIEMRQRQFILALERQLRPGVAANEDSLATVIVAIHETKQALLDATKARQEAFATFLDPVQQAQLVLMLERFQRQVENQLRRRMGGNRPGPGTG
jgi:hypothetical protein